MKKLYILSAVFLFAVSVSDSLADDKAKKETLTTANTVTKGESNMSFDKQNLPYEVNNLEPAISSRTVEYHFGKHQQGYADKLSSLIKDTPFEEMDLVTIIKETAPDTSKTAIFNNAAQLWNHIFYWDNLSAYKESNSIPEGDFLTAVKTTFGSEENLKKELLDASTNLFGSGWVWLTVDPKTGVLTISKTQNAATPITDGLVPLLTIDVWEHAYYLDYQNRRPAYAQKLIDNLINWVKVNERYKTYLDNKK